MNKPEFDSFDITDSCHVTPKDFLIKCLLHNSVSQSYKIHFSFDSTELAKTITFIAQRFKRGKF